MINIRSIFATVAAVVSLTQVTANVGRASWDSLGTTPCPVQCNPPTTDFGVALPVTLFPNGENCCHRVRVTYQGKSVDVTFNNLFLAGANSNNISLSHQAFAQLAPLEVGTIFPVDWEFVPIPTN